MYDPKATTERIAALMDKPLAEVDAELVLDEHDARVLVTALMVFSNRATDKDKESLASIAAQLVPQMPPEWGKTPQEEA